MERARPATLGDILYITLGELLPARQVLPPLVQVVQLLWISGAEEAQKQLATQRRDGAAWSVDFCSQSLAIMGGGGAAAGDRSSSAEGRAAESEVCATAAPGAVLSLRLRGGGDERERRRRRR